MNLNRDAITVVNPTLDGSAAITGEIDLSPYAVAADMDGRVDASDGILVGDRVYVALGHYWFDSGFAAHYEGSELAVIDATTDTLVDADATTAGMQGIALDHDNPWRGMTWVEEDGRIWVGATGDLFAIDGAIEAVDPVALASTGTILDETSLDAEINAYARVASNLVLVLAGTTILAVDPADVGAATTVADEIDGMLVVGDTLYAWSRSGSSPGLHAYDAATGAEITRRRAPTSSARYRSSPSPRRPSAARTMRLGDAQSSPGRARSARSRRSLTPRSAQRVASAMRSSAPPCTSITPRTSDH